MPGPHGYTTKGKHRYTIDWEPLRRQRRSMHITQRALADAVGVSAMTIYRIETGTHRPTVDLALRICEELGVPLFSIMERTKT